MAFSEAFLDDLRARLPMSSVVGMRIELSPKGKKLIGRSPFSDDHADTLVVDDDESYFEDAPSGKRGDIFAFVEATENCSFDDAVKRLASRAGVEIEGVAAKTNGAAHPLPDDAISQAERDLLGLLILNPALYEAAMETIGASDFSTTTHGHIFTSIENARLGDEPVTIDLLVKVMGGDPKRAALTGFDMTVGQYIAHLAAHAPVSGDQAATADELAREIRADSDVGTAQEAPKPFKSQFGGMPFEDLDAPGPEHEYLIDGWMTVGDKSIIGGPSKSGKSFLAIDCAGCIATGKDFFGAKVMAPGLVIYQAGEGARGVKKRFRAWRQYHAIEKGQRVPIYILQSKIDLYRPAEQHGDTAKLIEEIKGVQTLYDVPLRAVFIDTLATATGGADENSGKDMSTVMANVDKLAQAIPGCHVCLVHHFNAAGTKLRGHSSIYNNIDQVVLVTKDENSKVRTAVLDKQKDGEDGAHLKFELHVLEVGKRRIDGAPITSCVTLPSGGGAIARLEGKGAFTIKLTAERAVILQALKDAIAEHGEKRETCQLPEIQQLPKSIKWVVDTRRWKEQYLRKAPDGQTAKDNTINARMRAASNQFQTLKIIGRINPYVWLTGRAVAGVVEVEKTPDPAMQSGDQGALPPSQEDMIDP